MQLANWSEQLLRVQQSQGTERFYPALCQLLGQLQHADECVVLLFRPQGLFGEKIIDRV